MKLRHAWAESTRHSLIWVMVKGKNKRIFWFHSSYVLWETAKIVIEEQLKQENQRKLFEKLLFMIIRPEFKTVGCFDRFVQVFIAVSVVSVVSLVSFRCFGGFGGSGGFVSVFRWFRWFRSGGFVSVFRVLVHAYWQPLQTDNKKHSTTKTPLKLWSHVKCVNIF